MPAVERERGAEDGMGLYVMRLIYLRCAELKEGRMDGTGIVANYLISPCVVWQSEHKCARVRHNGLSPFSLCQDPFVDRLSEKKAGASLAMLPSICAFHPGHERNGLGPGLLGRV